MSTLTLEPIAILESCYKEKFGTPKQGVLCPESSGFVRMQSPYTDFSYIQDLNLYSHLWLIGGFHLSQKTKNAKVRVPRLLGGKISSLATRSPHRPNPLSLSLVKISSVMEGGIHINGLDLVDGTPIYDIKPYLPDYDICKDATSKLQTKKSLFKVVYSQEAENTLKQIESNHPHYRFQKVLTESLRYDPRPIAYLEKYADRVYGLRLHNYNIHFYFLNETIVVKDIVSMIESENNT